MVTGASETAIVRRGKALDLRCGGATYRQIGVELGVSGKTAWQDVEAALADASADRPSPPRHAAAAVTASNSSVKSTSWPRSARNVSSTVAGGGGSDAPDRRRGRVGMTPTQCHRAPPK